ncbi:MAG: flavin reductase family protein [Candidatus Sericytochromatia bacterium]|nr:flavin reductase family protein [Candidatus Sericytochromatia bacterium]
MYLDPNALSPQDAYKFMIGAIVPRPIAWVSSVSPEGVVNLAPFSFFTGICANPLTLCFAPMRRTDGTTKDTLNNITATREFVVNIVSEPLVEAMNRSSEQFPPDESEFAATGLTAVPSRIVTPPRVGESLVQFECQVHEIVTISEAPLGGSLVIGRVVALHVDEAIYHNGRIDLAGLQPIGRCAGQTYVRTTDVFELARPDASYIGK